ncbi:hypothetical protein Tco_0942916, partial [Tanacetum coccineum]
LVRAGDKTSGDARSWYMISGDAKSWVPDCSAYIHYHIAQLCVVIKGNEEYLGPTMSTFGSLLKDNGLTFSKARLVNTESDPEEAPSKAEELQVLGSRVPFIGKEFEAVEPSGTRTDSSYSSASSDSTTLDDAYDCACPARHVPGYLARVTEVMALSDLAFRKRYRSSYESPSSSSSLALLVRKRYRGMSELILDTDREGDELGDKDIEDDEEDESLDADDKEERSNDEGHGSDDEGHGLSDEDHRLDDKGRGLKGEGLSLEDKEEEAALKGQQQAVPIVDTAMSEPLGLVYGAAWRCALESIEEIAPSTYEVDPADDRVNTDILVYPPVAPVQTPLSPEWSSGSLPVSPSSPVAPSPIASPVATSTTTMLVGEDQFIKVGVQLELHGSILQDHTYCLDSLPPTLVVDLDWDVRELYTRLVLALEAWAGHVDTRLEDTSRDRYGDHRLIHDMLVQQAAMQREL